MCPTSEFVSMIRGVAANQLGLSQPSETIPVGRYYVIIFAHVIIMCVYHLSNFIGSQFVNERNYIENWDGPGGEARWSEW